jgi:hypothetical protein
MEYAALFAEMTDDTPLPLSNEQIQRMVGAATAKGQEL